MAEINNIMRSNVRKVLADRFSPVVAVFSSHTVRETLQKNNGFSPAEFLRPFGEVGNLGNISL
jgi:hypothetical protein